MKKQADGSILGKSVPEHQLAFEDFFLEKEDYSHTLEFFDFCGAFVHRLRSMKQDKLPIIEETFSHRGVQYLRQIVPAALLDDEGQTVMSYPTKREELVMHALRYMAAQQVVEMGLDDKESRNITITFTLHQLRKELQKRGHGYKWSELDEALDVLSRSTLKISYSDSKKRDSWSAPYLLGVQGRDTEGPGGAGSESLRRVILHPLASLAILTTATRRINYGRLMTLKNPLSRWLYSRMCHYCTNASHWRAFASQDAIGFRFTLRDVLEQSGCPRAARHRDNFRLVRKAITELIANGALHDPKVGFGHAFVENADEETWIIYPSKEVVAEIVDANRANSRPAQKLGLSD